MISVRYRVQKKLFEELTAITEKDEVKPIVLTPRSKDRSNFNGRNVPFSHLIHCDPLTDPLLTRECVRLRMPSYGHRDRIKR